MRIVISLDNKKLERFLKKRPLSYRFIYLADRNNDVIHLLNEAFVTEIKLSDHDQALKDKIIQPYVELIGKLGLKYNSIYWWRNYTSSKNLVVSKLLSNLFIFYALVKRLEENPALDLLIINPPLGICDSLARYCKANSIELKVLSSRLDNLGRAIRRFMITTLSGIFFVYQTWRKIRISNKYLKNKIVNLDRTKGKYYVLRSWVYATSFDTDNNYHDAFFGILPAHLLKNGQNLLIIGGIIGDYETLVRKMSNTTKFTIIPQECFLRYIDPIKAVISTFLHKIRIGEKLEFDGSDITDILKADISENHLYIAGEYLHTYYIKRMLNLIDINIFTSTYENNPWEKICFHTLRAHSPETKTIGYQHVPLSRAHLPSFMNKHENKVIPAPDRINTIGKANEKLLHKYGSYSRDKIRTSCALRFHFPSASELFQRRNTKRLLVALRGNRYQAIDLTNFVYTGLKDASQYNVIIRPHPLLPLKKFKSELVFDYVSSSNFLPSDTAAIKQELQTVDIVIYEGSAVAIEALALGIPIIHVDLDDVTNWDPLFECEHFRWSITQEDALLRTVKAIYSLDDNEYHHQQALSRQYIADLANEANEQGLDEFII